MNLEEALDLFNIAYDSSEEERREAYGLKRATLQAELAAAKNPSEQNEAEAALEDMNEAMNIIQMMAPTQPQRPPSVEAEVDYDGLDTEEHEIDLDEVDDEDEHIDVPITASITKAETESVELELETNLSFSDVKDVSTDDSVSNLIEAAAEEIQEKEPASIQEEHIATDAVEEDLINEEELEAAIVEEALPETKPTTKRRANKSNKAKPSKSNKRNAKPSRPARESAKQSGSKGGKGKLMMAAVLALLLGGGFWYYQDYQAKIQAKRDTLATHVSQANEFLSACDALLADSAALLTQMNSDISEKGDGEKSTAYYQKRHDFYQAYHQWLEKEIKQHALHADLAAVKDVPNGELDAALTRMESAKPDEAAWSSKQAQQCASVFSKPLLAAFLQSKADANKLNLFRAERGSQEAIAEMQAQLEKDVQASVESAVLDKSDIHSVVAIIESNDNETFRQMGLVSILAQSTDQENEWRTQVKSYAATRIAEELSFLDEAAMLGERSGTELLAILEDTNNAHHQLMQTHERMSGDSAQRDTWMQTLNQVICQQITARVEAANVATMDEKTLHQILYVGDHALSLDMTLHARLSGGDQQRKQWQANFESALLAKVEKRLSAAASVDILSAHDEAQLTAMLEDEQSAWAKDVAVFKELGGKQDVADAWNLNIQKALATHIVKRLAFINDSKKLGEQTEADLEAMLNDESNTIFAAMKKHEAWSGSSEQSEQWHAAIKVAIAAKIEQRLPFNPSSKSFASVDMGTIYKALKGGVFTDLKKHAQYTKSSDFAKKWKRDVMIGVGQRFAVLSKKTIQELDEGALQPYEDSLRMFKAAKLSKKTYDKWYKHYQTIVTNSNTCMQISTYDYDSLHTLSLNSKGHLFVSGDTDGSLGGPGLGDHDVYLLSYDATGTQIMKQQFGSSGLDIIAGSHVDKEGFMYVSGYCEGKLAGSKKGVSDIFVLKMDAGGTIVWKTQLGTSGRETAQCMHVDDLGNVYIAGSSDQKFYAKNNGLHDAVIVKISSLGEVMWGKQFGSKDDDFVTSMDTDGLGNLYVCGTTKGDLFAKRAGQSGDQDMFLAKYSAEGQALWSKQFGGTGRETPTSLLCHSNQHIYVGGHTYGTTFATKRSRDTDALLMAWTADGKQVWAKQWARGIGGEKINALSQDTKGRIYAAGSEAKNAKISRLDINGKTLWSKTINSHAEDTGTAVAISDKGDIYFGGITKGALFNVLPHKEDAFVIKFDKNDKSFLDYKQTLAELK